MYSADTRPKTLSITRARLAAMIAMGLLITVLVAGMLHMGCGGGSDSSSGVSSGGGGSDSPTISTPRVTRVSLREVGPGRYLEIEGEHFGNERSIRDNGESYVTLKGENGRIVIIGYNDLRAWLDNYITLVIP